MNRMDGADAPYWQGLSEGRLLLPRCGGCDGWLWPAAHRCGACGATSVHWVERAMRATVFSWTRTWHRFGGTEAFELPFTNVLAAVDDCGIRLLGRLEGSDSAAPAIGEPLVGRPGETVVGDDRIPTILWSRAA